ncbi:MAG TPA: MBL fold metallo-hydrolase [Desulfatiglandales bacterium]|nr:MBL fold metallo-hydrolase [Desulfatiglandales bacterium]
MMIKPFPKLEIIHAIAIPMPEPPDLITANLYAVGKGPITLIDTGPKIPGSLEFIKKKLHPAGFDFSDIERIIITHGHVDHFGLAVSIQETAGHPIECFIHAQDSWRVSRENFREELWTEGMERFMTMTGMPKREIQKMKNRFSAFRSLADPLEDAYSMDDGDEFKGDGYHLKIIHTPGHSLGTCCLYESQQKVLFSGDHIIKHITPNPFVEINRNHLRETRYQSLRAYLESLDKLAGLDVRFVFPGHGEYVKDLPGIISSYRVHHRERMDLVWNALKKQSRPIYHLIDDIFPFVPENDAFLAVSEIFVHLEILINEGRAELADSGPPALYRAL